MKALIISGLLIHLSDNIIPFLDKDTDVYCHTWNKDWNGRWMIKLNRYKKYCNNLHVEFENLKFDKKLHSYFYSTYRAVNMIQNIDQYDKIVKFKPNVEGIISYKGDIDYYFLKGKLQSRPLLNGINIDDCIFGTIHYKTIDERMFTAKPKAFKKAFGADKETFTKEMKLLDEKCMKTYGETYEGSIFWTKWFEDRDIYPILDIDIKIPNSINYDKEIGLN